jgi:uncharacterized RDD family membrane protein YckC
MTQPSGWYDDPKDPTQLRYWDGVVWSSHVTPKISPTVAQSNIGMPYGVSPSASRSHTSGSQGAQGAPTAQGGYGPSGSGGRDQWPAYGQQRGWQSHPSTTPDGAQLASWWLRVGARLLDVLFTFVLSLPLTGWFYYHYIVGFMDWIRPLVTSTAAGSAPLVALPPADVTQYAVTASLIGLLVAFGYEVFFLSRSGATPGKMIVGISVRLRDRAGPPPMRAILARTVCYFLAIALLGVISLLDVLGPLWDDKKQAVHDKIAGTNVVMGPQPRASS